jgi:hypothetical protein
VTLEELTKDDPGVRWALSSIARILALPPDPQMRDNFCSTNVLFMHPTMLKRLFGVQVDPEATRRDYPFELNASRGVLRAVNNHELDFVLAGTPAGYHGVFVAPAELSEAAAEVYRSLWNERGVLSSADALVAARGVTRIKGPG